MQEALNELFRATTRLASVSDSIVVGGLSDQEATALRTAWDAVDAALVKAAAHTTS